MTAARSRQWISVSLVAAAVAGTFWLYIHTSGQARTPSGASQLPELYIVQPDWTLFDPNGQADKRMRAERLEQWHHEEGARLFEPRMQISDQQRRRWHARARQGRIYPDKASIVLEKQVVLHREPETGGLVVTTSRLHIAHQGDSVETDAPVELQAGSWHFTSKGLRSSLGGQRLELLGQVNGELRSKRSPPEGRGIQE